MIRCERPAKSVNEVVNYEKQYLNLPFTSLKSYKKVVYSMVI